jgi:hypothetical protein
MNDSRFSTKRFGLNERETQLMLSALNGIGLLENFIPTTKWLSQEIYAAGVESHIDLEEMGFDLGLGEGVQRFLLNIRISAKKSKSWLIGNQRHFIFTRVAISKAKRGF